jgi:hypothetical protein
MSFVAIGNTGNINRPTGATFSDNLSDLQLQLMDAPLQIPSPLWKFSNVGERRALLEGLRAVAESTTSLSGTIQAGKASDPGASGRGLELKQAVQNNDQVDPITQSMLSTDGDVSQKVISTEVKTEKYGGYPVTNKLATMWSKEGLGYLDGLGIKGNVLYGTVLVKFSNPQRLSIDKEQILRDLSQVNQTGTDGYAIRLTFKEAGLWNSTMHPLSPSINISIVDDMSSTHCPGAGACYVEGPLGKTIIMEPSAPRHFIVHEFLHNMGLNHSGFKESVVFPAAKSTDVNQILLRNGEISNIVEGYRGKIGK